MIDYIPTYAILCKSLFESSEDGLGSQKLTYFSEILCTFSLSGHLSTQKKKIARNWAEDGYLETEKPADLSAISWSQGDQNWNEAAKAAKT